jgi:predicted 3-demethylubiquinone-9 3-methyltransferase (glyoxalase superfamily)
MARTIPCLWFNGNGEEAANYYVSVFPNSRIAAVSRYPDAAGPFPPGTALTVEFELDGQPYTALNGAMDFPFSEAISLQIMCEDQAEIDHYWDTLVGDGGEEGPCGWLEDKFGLSWQVVPTDVVGWTTDPRTCAAVMDAISGMKKLDLAALRAAVGDA